MGDVLVRNTLPFSTCRTTKPDQSREARDGWHGQEAATAHRLGRRALPFGSAASGSTRRDAARAAARQRPADPTIARPIPESNKHLPGRVLHEQPKPSGGFCQRQHRVVYHGVTHPSAGAL